MTLLVLAGGLWLFGTGEALLVAAGLGVSPWTVLAQGLGTTFGVGVGVTTFATSLLVLLLWLPLKVTLGLGTVANAVVIALSLGVMAAALPAGGPLVVRLLEVLVGVLLIGLGSGLYLTVGMGPGPRDGLMTGLHRRTGLPVAAVRLGIEVTVLVIGWLLGGTVGVGTVAFALLVGPAVGYGLLLAGLGNAGRAGADAPTLPE